MPDITRHDEGAFSYSDLATSDLEAATSFYVDLFGWHAEDSPMNDDDPTDIYRQFMKNGKVVCGAARQRPEQAQAGVPPMWNVYFTVSDVDLKAKEVEAAGGAVHAPPFDVFESGRMAVIADPAGAFFCLWQPKESIGADVMHEANTLDWAESGCTDVGAARDFYTKVLGWTYEEMDMGEGKFYTLFSIGDTNVAGLMESQMPMSYWSIYFQVEDCKQMTARAQSLGAQMMMNSEEIEGVGTVTIASDPQGAMFGMIEPEATE